MYEKLLYKKSPAITMSNKVDERPQIPHDVFEYQFDKGYINPFGIIVSGLRVHRESMYSAQLPLGYLHAVRLSISPLLKNRIDYHGQLLSVTHAYYDNFYHFTLECLLKIFLLREHIGQPDTKILMPEMQKKFHKEWFEILGLSDHVMTIEETDIMMPRNIITCSFPATSSNQHREIINDFREWVLGKVTPLIHAKKNIKKVFIGRAIDGRRNIHNREEVIGIFEKYGYVYMEMDNLSLLDQLNVFINATHIAGLHGAALSHLTFARRDAQVIELINKNFHVHFFEKICLALEISYVAVQCQPASDIDNPNHADIEVDMHGLEKILSVQA